MPIWVLMNTTLGQAFKFYCFQPESIRNEIAKAFSSLCERPRETDMISPRRLRLAYDHIAISGISARTTSGSIARNISIA